MILFYIWWVFFTEFYLISIFILPNQRKNNVLEVVTQVKTKIQFFPLKRKIKFHYETFISCFKNYFIYHKSPKSQPKEKHPKLTHFLLLQTSRPDNILHDRKMSEKWICIWHRLCFIWIWKLIPDYGITSTKHFLCIFRENHLPRKVSVRSLLKGL